MKDARRIVILAEGYLDFHHGKTATSLLRYRPDVVVSVIDSRFAGLTTQDVLGLGGAIPVVASVEETLSLGPNALLIGIAPRGGGLPNEFRRQILAAIRHGMNIISGLHTMLNDDPVFVEEAHRYGVHLLDVRRPPESLPVAAMLPRPKDAHVVTFVGSDCAVGKMTAALELVRSARKQGLSAAFVATGQTGIMLEGSGIAIDRVVGDFMAGATEQLVLEAIESAEWVFVEGQGSLLHPGYSGVTLALLHGSAPDAMILVHQAGQTVIDEYTVPIPTLDQVVRIYEEAAGWIKPARVVGIALNTRHLNDDETELAIAEAKMRTQLPVSDPIKSGGSELLSAVIEARGSDNMRRLEAGLDA
jgi:uncharacterized NAD-dependent epimerase/dehydratase family protein